MTNTVVDIRSCLQPGDADKAAFQRLLVECKRHDRVAVPENFDKSLNAVRDMPSWFFAYAEGGMRGALSVFAPDMHEAEIVAAVDPEWRRHGIFGLLLEAASAELRGRGYTSLLFVTDPRSAVGSLVLGKIQAKHEYSEYTLRYEPDDESRARVAKTLSSIPAGISVRRASGLDTEALVRVVSDAFGDEPGDVRAFTSASLAHPRRSLFVLEKDGDIVASIGHLNEESNDYINAFAVRSDLQGTGLGKVLLAWLVDAIERGAVGGKPEAALQAAHPAPAEILMDVETTNDGAFGLYRSMGFKVFKSADYCRLAL